MDPLVLVNESAEGLTNEAGEFLTSGEALTNLVVLPGVGIAVAAGTVGPPQNATVTLTGAAIAVTARDLTPIETHVVTIEIVVDETLPTVFAVEMYPALVTGA